MKGKYSDIRKIILIKWPKAKIKFIKEFEEGYNNIAYDVRLSNGNYVIKLLKIKGYEKEVLKQKHIRTMIRRKFKDFPIAKIIKSDFSRKIIERSYVITEKIEGNSLQSLYGEVQNKEELFGEIGELYGKMHSFKLENYGEFDFSLNIVKAYGSWYLAKCKVVEKLLKKIENHNLLSKKTLQMNKEFFDKNKFLLKKETPPCLCHGDIADSNIILKKSGKGYNVEGIIDFEFARASTATHDLFKGIRSFEKKYKYRDSLIKGHARWNKLPKEWEKLIFLYQWMSHLDQLTRIKNMKWRNLNEGGTLNRKKDLRKKSLLMLRESRKKLSS